MTVRERILAVINFEKPTDRMPLVEWAAWWGTTVDRWKTEGLPDDVHFDNLIEHFGLDRFACLCLFSHGKGFPHPKYHGAPLISNLKEYRELRKCMYTHDVFNFSLEQAQALKERHDKGEIAVRLWLDGFFWEPRNLLGIENHLYAFYDEPELMHEMCRDLCEYHLRGIEAIFEILTPDVVGFAEDMSYNNGPMLSHEMYMEFIHPYYKKVIPEIHKRGVKVWVDTDGDVMPMIPWLIESGVDGIFPLERQAGVDVNEIRRLYPNLNMMGGYDKMVMDKGEAAMRAEFERLLPAIKSGGFIPSVDHQTPPGVSLADYEIYLRLFKEYMSL
ncbi:MAG: hypothetical protein FWC71_03265 [Defluviitaleaceae bacterium]|nr:hypothetical protein [Defluviitaleaceae bacterium]